jgi:GAF domain-containing protein/HAMP domain-containing protein
MNRSFTLGQRIALGASILVFFVLFASGLGIWYTNTVANTLSVTQERVQEVNRIAQLEVSLGDLIITIDGMLLSRQQASYSEELQDQLASFKAQLQRLEDDPIGGSGTGDETVANLLAYGEGIDKVARSILAASEDREWARAQVTRHMELASLERRFGENLQQLRQTVESNSVQVVADAEAQQTSIGSLLTAGALIAAVTGALLAYASIRSITGPVRQLTERVQQVTEGNFSFVPPMDRNDEIGTLSRSFSLMTEWLQDSYHALEDRVRERTADLALAAEVAQTLGRVRDMDQLLQNSVDLVRERFDLYYVQVYLMSEDGRRLVLRAGTGSVGQELLRRGFQLPVDRYSINGTAALDRHPVIIPDTEDSGIFRPNALLPDTLSEMAIPLLAGDRVVGVLDLQSSRRYSLSEDNLPAFNVLSGQLAIAIENAYLFEDIERARSEMEAQMSQRVSEQWQEFLDAVQRSEEIGFAYSQGNVVPASGTRLEVEEGPERSLLRAPLTLFDQQIGSIQLKAAENSSWSNEAEEMVRVVARQVAQQVENLRLLAEAERYQLEAEAAVRRLTREGWQEYVSGAAQGQASYLYDGRQVVAHSNGFGADGLTQPLLIRGEPIGELLVEGDDSVLDDEAVSLISEVADHLSSHLENLRLTQQTEQALAEARQRSEELELLNQIVTEISGTLELKESLEIVVDQLVATTAADQARIALLDEDGDSLTVVAEQYDESRTPSALGLVIPVEGNTLTQQVLESRKPVHVIDAQHHPSTKIIHDMLAEQGIHSLLVMPILAGQDVIGTVGMDILEPDKRFSDNELQLAETMVYQAAAAIQNAQLFDQVQKALAETRALYQAGAELNRARTYDDVLAVVRRHTIAGEGSASVSITMFDAPWTENRKPKMLDVLASWSPEPAPAEASVTRMSMDDFPAAERLMQRDRSMLVRDVKTDPRLDAQSRKLLLASNARSIISMPLLVGGQWIGHLNVTYAEPFSFGDRDPELQRLRTLVTQASVAVQSINLLEETTRLLESEQRRRRLSDTLVRVTGRMLDVMDEQQIREVIIDEIQNLTAPDQLSLYEWLPERDVLRVDIRKVRGHDQSEEAGGKLIHRHQRSDLWQVVDSGEILLRQLTDPEQQVRHHYVLPWMVGTERAGVIDLVTAPDSDIREEDRASIEGIVEQAAVRLQNARLYAESELRAEEMAALNEMSQVLTAQRDVAAVLDTVYTFASRLMDTSNFYVALQEPGESLLRFPIFIQDGERIDWPDREPGNGLTEYVLRERQPLLIEGQAEQRIAQMGLEVAGRPARSWLGVPMLYGEDVTGVLAVRDLEVVSRYDRHDQDLLGAMANAAAIALQNARLFEETQQQAAETESLYRASRQINTAENYKEILAALREHTILGDGSHSVSIEYFDRPWQQGDEDDEVRPQWVDVLARWTTLPTERLQTRYPLNQFALSETLIKPGEATVMQDIAQDLRLDAHTRALLIEYLGAASAIFVPLVVGGQWWGLVTTVYSETLEYSDDQLRQLMSLAGQAATAIHSLHLLEQTQNRARRERVLREITERVRSATDVDVIMKTAVREVGRALGREAFVYLSEEQRMREQSEAIASKDIASGDVASGDIALEESG